MFRNKPAEPVECSAMMERSGSPNAEKQSEIHSAERLQGIDPQGFPL